VGEEKDKGKTDSKDDRTDKCIDDDHKEFML
jgi:hypothetical protein